MPAAPQTATATAAKTMVPHSCWKHLMARATTLATMMNMATIGVEAAASLTATASATHKDLQQLRLSAFGGCRRRRRQRKRSSR